MKTLTISLLISLFALNCSNVGTGATTGTAATSGTAGPTTTTGTTVAANMAVVKDASGNVIGNATDVTPWLIRIVFSSGYMSNIDFDGNLKADVLDIYYGTTTCTGSTFVKYSVSAPVAKFILKSSAGTIYQPRFSNPSGSSVTSVRNLYSYWSASTNTCVTSPTYVGELSVSVYEVSTTTLSAAGISATYTTPLNIQYN
jgi:hypothetical protein